VASVAPATGRAGDFGVLTTETSMQQALSGRHQEHMGWSYALQALEMGSVMGVLPG